MILKVTSRIARWGRLLFLPHFGCSSSHLSVRNNLFAVLISFYSLFLFSMQNVNAMELSSDSQVATAGYYQLSWSGQAEIFQVQESADANFDSYTVIYKGKDLARVVSGKPDGDYFYRVTNNSHTPRISNVVKVTVAHHPLENAILFFIAGAIVFIATLLLILKGNKETSAN